MKGVAAFGVAKAPDWQPSAEIVARSRLLAAMRKWGVEDLETLHQLSIDDPEWFWRAVVDDLHVDFEAPFERVKDETDGRLLPKWFVGGRINAARLCASRHAEGPLASKDAVVYEGDAGQRRALTYRELDASVRDFAAQLAALGVRRGDRVVLFLPVVPEAAVAYLACAWLGAISVPAFTGYGAEALASRLVDSGAEVLVTADATTRRGKRINLKETADDALAGAPGVQHVVVVRHLGDGASMTEGRDVYFDELPPAAHVEMADTDSNDPVTIIYTSGTTGRPKGIVHSHAGFLVKSATDFAYGFDIHEDDVVAWIADMGWMLGPLMLMGGLQLGATLVMTEGVPDYPTPQRLWQIAERNKVTFQGISPSAARLVMARERTPSTDISTIRSFASTGEPWDDPTWHWLFEEVGGGSRPIVNYSGGTETGGGILVAYPFLSMCAAAFNGPLPGMDVGVVDQDGKSMKGELGELVVFNTWPGMTHAFWQDRQRYLETYWSRWENVWFHGDLASVGDDGWRLYGRSDDTIKVSGRRVGPAEIETALLKDPRVIDAAAIGVPDQQRGQRVVAFVVVASGIADDDDVIRTAEHNVGRAFAPMLHLVNSVPKTKNGKIMRRAIRARYLGTPEGDLSSLDPATPLDDIPIQHNAGANK